MPVDPCFVPLLDAMSKMPPPPPDRDPIQSAREGTALLFGHAHAPDVAVTEYRAPVADGSSIGVRVYRPRSAHQAKPLVVFFHGGGFLAGSLDSHDGTARELAVQADAVVASVDYRLAPEAPFPTPLEDCYSALQWAVANAGSIGADSTRVAIAGDSAGGNLAAAVALVNRDRDAIPLRLQLLIYPVIDPACTTESMQANSVGYMLTADSMRWMWSQYLADPAHHSHPYAAPSTAESLEDLPPAVVITAEFDPLRDEGEAYAAALAAAGVPTELRREDGQIHGFFSMYDIAPRAHESTAFAAERLRSAFA
jgi:acetyl esterase